MSINVREILEECDALTEGHFLLSSGKHSNKYCQCAKLMQYPDRTEIVISIIADKVKDLGIDIVVGPAMGGITAAYELGKQLGIRAMFAERENNIMTFRRGFEIEAGERVLVIEDVVTTGKTAIELATIVESYGGIVLGVGCIVDRKSSDLTLPIYSAVELEFETYNSDNCPLCKTGSRPVKPGSRKF